MFPALSSAVCLGVMIFLL